jgi:hypothetical protein
MSMPDDDAAREYAEAKAQYLIALKRLKAAKAALPPNPDHRKQLQKEAAERSAAVWQRYLNGERDMARLAKEFGRSKSYIQTAVAHERYARQFGPHRPDEWWSPLNLRQQEQEEEYMRTHGIRITGRLGL